MLTGSTFLFSLAQDQGHFCKSSPTAPPPGFVPCSPQPLIFLLDCWSKPLGYLHLADIANDSPLSCHLQGLKRQRSPRGAVRHQSHQNLLGFSQVIPCCQDTPPPTSSGPGEPGWLPAPQATIRGHPVLSFANLAHLVSGTEASDERDCSYEVFFFFFLFVLLDKSIISSLSSQVSRSSTSLFLPLPSRPLPTRDPHTPRLGHCVPDPAALGQLFKGPGAFVKVGCRHAGRRLFLFVVLFFQPTLEQREKPGSTHKQIQSEETDRSLEAGHQKDGVRVEECPRWQGP